MSVFKFRVVADTEDDIFRDIELLMTHTFEDLHKVILKAFEFPEGEMASFYVSNDDWDKGEEITLVDMGASQDGTVLTMHDTVLKDVVRKEGEKLIYVYDFLRMWCFYVELVDILPEENDNYPRIILAFGDSPEFESKEIDFSAMDDFEGDGDLSGEFDDDDEPDIFEDFDDFDNLQYE